MAQSQSADTRQRSKPSLEAQVKGGEHSQVNQVTGSQNQPSHAAQVKGGQHPHSGKESDSGDSRSQNQPSHEAQVKGGQHSRSGGSNR